MSTLSKIIPIANIPEKWSTQETQETGIEVRLAKTLRKIADFIIGFIVAFVETVKKGFTMLFSDTLAKKEIEIIPLQKTKEMEAAKDDQPIEALKLALQPQEEQETDEKLPVEETKELELALQIQEEPKAVKEKLPVEETKELGLTPQIEEETKELEAAKDDQPIEALKLALQSQEEEEIEIEEELSVEEPKEAIKSYGSAKKIALLVAAFGVGYVAYDDRITIKCDQSELPWCPNWLSNHTGFHDLFNSFLNSSS